MALTQHRPHGALAGRRFGAFSGKTNDTGSGHPVARITQNRPHGALSGRRFGSFAGKTGGGSDWDFAAPVELTTIAGTIAITGDFTFGAGAFSLAQTGSLAIGGTVALAGDFAYASGGSSAANIFLGSRWLTEAIKHGESIANVYAGVGPRAAPLENPENIADNTPANLKSWLPAQKIPIAFVEIDGKKYPVNVDAATWYKFFYFVAEIKLGGVNGPTLTNVASDLIATKAQASAVSAEQALVTQQVQANAEALLVTVQVSQNAALPGSDQIPPVEVRYEA